MLWVWLRVDVGLTAATAPQLAWMGDKVLPRRREGGLAAGYSVIIAFIIGQTVTWRGEVSPRRRDGDLAGQGTAGQGGEGEQHSGCRQVPHSTVGRGGWVRDGAKNREWRMEEWNFVGRVGWPSQADRQPTDETSSGAGWHSARGVVVASRWDG